MIDLIYEREYAREILFAAIRCQAGSERGGAATHGADDITALIERAMDVGCGKTQLIVELASLGARLFAGSAPDNGLGDLAGLAGLAGSAGLAPAGEIADPTAR